MTETLVHSWSEFESKAKELVTAGYKYVTPNDKPLHLQVGYMFTSESGEEVRVLARIAELKDNLPDTVRTAFSTEQGKINIAKAWGTYKELVLDPNVETLTFEQTMKLIKENPHLAEK
jgi:hypothetical protein